MNNLPKVCAELRLCEREGVPVVNSRDVAEMFEKEHRHVLRDIDHILLSPNLGSVEWFKETSYIDPTGRTLRSFDLTRDGFSLLVMGWTGAKALAFKVKYIEAFNAMEASLKSSGSDERFLAAVREIVAPLGVRFSQQDVAIGRIEHRVDTLSEDMAHVKHALLHRRRNLTAETKRVHVEAIKSFGGRCPCCGEAEVVQGDQRSVFAEFDHFYANSQPSAEHTWLICRPCHTALSTGRVSRDQREAEFRAYQNKRRRLPGAQPSLF